MRKSTKLCLLSAAALIVLGSATFTITACSIHWDFKKFNTVTLETNAYTVDKSFQSISIDVNTANLEFLPSTNEECRVLCHEDIKQKSVVGVENDTLTIQSIDERAWYDHLSVGGDNPIIKIYLPQTQYKNLAIEISTGDITIPKHFTFDSVNISGATGDVDFSASVATNLTVEVSTGDITLKNMSADSAKLTTSTGEISLYSVAIANDLTTQASTGATELKDITCKNFTHNSSNGDIEMDNVILSEKMSITVSTGDVEFEGCDAGEIYIKTTTGDVEGSLLTAKDFHADSNTGDVKVPNTSVGGKCEITCSTGDIKITVINN